MCCWRGRGIRRRRPPECSSAALRCLRVPALLTGGVSSEAIPFIAASAALELVYFVLLARAYAGGEVSVIYPIARGSAPVVVLVFGAIALNEDVSAGRRRRCARHRRRGPPRWVRRFTFPCRQRKSPTPSGRAGLGWRSGLVIASYTLVDSEAVEHADPIAYLALVIAPCALVYPVRCEDAARPERADAPSPPRPPSAPSSWCSPRSGSRPRRRWPR